MKNDTEPPATDLSPNSVAPSAQAVAPAATSEEERKKKLAILGLGAAGCVTLAVVAVIALAVVAFLIYGVWLFLTNPYGVTF